MVLFLPTEMSAQSIITRPTTKETPTTPRKKKKVVSKKSPVVTPRTQCKNLDLYTRRAGKSYFFSVDEWQALPEPEKQKYTKKGLVISNKGELFALDLEGTKFNGQEQMTWDMAYRLYGNTMPNVDQCEAMKGISLDISKALEAFGGSGNPFAFWSCTEKDTGHAYGHNLNFDTWFATKKEYPAPVRLVSEIK